MSRKYEIVNVGGLSRVRALRPWVVQGRQVNVGDVGGAVFDERTLSQDGACWIFSGRLNNPLVRVGGDSVVDIGDANPSRFPFVNIFGTSSLDANAGLSFAIKNLSSASPLTPDKMEQGGCEGSEGQPLTKVTATDRIRSAEHMFTGGGSWVVPAPAEGYYIRVVATDADGIVVYNSGNASTAVTVPAGAHAYAYIIVMKNPLSAIVPADVTAAAVTFQSYAEATLNIVDSHITVTSPDTGSVYITASGDYQGNVTNIEGSTLRVNRTGETPLLNLVCDLINTSATVNMSTGDVPVLGVYRNVKNLVWGTFSWGGPLKSRTIIQATDCDNFVVDDANIPGETMSAVAASNMPLVFTRCNMNKAHIVNQPLIKNTYEDINFDLATADLNESTASNMALLVSSNVNGMYRLRNTSRIGALVESHESVKSLKLPSAASVADSHNTTIYADAYINGTITLAGTNVFGNAAKKPETGTIDVARVAVQGRLNEVLVGRTVTGVVADDTYCTIPLPVNLRTAKGLTVKGLTGTLQCGFYVTDGKSVITDIIQWGGDRDLTGMTGVEQPQTYVAFHRSNSAAIKPEDLAGVTIETYNGCKIVNTKATAMSIAGNVRVEDNAALIDVSVTGTGYFGGNSITEAPTALTAPMQIDGAAYMKDNAVFSPSVSAADAGVSLLDMRDKAVFAGGLNAAATFYNITMGNNARFDGSTSTRGGFVMRGNSFVNSGVTVGAGSRGLCVMSGNARVESGNLTTIGLITLTGNYRQTATKTWTGKRVIDSQDAPAYDNNVRTRYDF